MDSDLVSEGHLASIIITATALLGCLLVVYFTRRIDDIKHLRKWLMRLSVVMLMVALSWIFTFANMVRTNGPSDTFYIFMGGFILLVALILRYAAKDILKSAKASGRTITDRMRFMFNLAATTTFIAVLGVAVPILR